LLVPFAQRQTCSSLEELVTRRCTLFFLLFRRFLHPNQDQAVYSKVLVNFRGTRFPSFLDEESGSFSYVERQVRFELVEHEGFEERKEEGRKEGRREGRQAGDKEGGREGGRVKPCVSSSLPFPRIVASGWCSAHTFVLRLVVHRTFPLASFHQFLLCVLVMSLQTA